MSAIAEALAGCGATLSGMSFLLAGWEPWSPFYPPASAVLPPDECRALGILQAVERSGDLCGVRSTPRSREDAALESLGRRGLAVRRPRTLIGERSARWVLTEAGRRA